MSKVKKHVSIITSIMVWNSLVLGDFELEQFGKLSMGNEMDEDNFRKDTWQDEGHAEDVKGKTQTTTADEAKDEDTQEKARGFASNHTTRVLENDSMERDNHGSEVNIENQTPLTAEAVSVQEKATTLVSEYTVDYT
ncbi:unnamed protein product [Sphenostylis stenocarpa]|uniref:Uncharacterized protein n=1 Tax=Sphenostylis stenocarpa TaxID=92480 RepID=A0AA86VZI7_9FABA|nr:unnamed protein product [Sphenostylis stenocarpa]